MSSGLRHRSIVTTVHRRLIGGGLLTVAAIILAGCIDTTSPRTVRGRYDLQTSLEGFTYAYGCPGVLYCYDTIPATGAMLKGLVHVLDTSTVMATLQMLDNHSTPGLDTVTMGGWLQLASPLTLRLTYGQTGWVTLYGTYTPDSIFGTLFWALEQHRHSYHGTFVMRRQ